ncbi:SPOR domain-containing protein [Cohnella abietis]|uniref:SPOR domain-containing protein n=1 Tax=Cohnella abietis TaxID=2507935 RepID=A0A3T1D3B1_9BACL|nr:SPOR domain-containing protein [Cohnella abietis]BBI32528.1 hypothetical protein KCTCHS21_19270 [Cohnella abietis]
MQPKARMTIRFEPQAKPGLASAPIVQTLVSKNELLIEKIESVSGGSQGNEGGFTSWNSPYQDDIHALEEIIRTTETVRGKVPLSKSALALEPTLMDIPHDELSEPKWTKRLPQFENENENENDDEDKNEAKLGVGWYNQTATIHEERGPSWGRVFLSVAGAIATGALFGYMVLSLFTGESLFPGKTNRGTQLPVQAAPGKSFNSSLPTADKSVEAKSVDGKISSNESSGKSVDEGTLTQVATDAYYMLQFGVFKNEESMQAAVKQLKDRGLAPATETREGYRVYVGAARSRNEADLLAAQMPDLEVYIKPLEETTLAISSQTLSEEAADFLNASANLTRKLTEYAGTGLLDKLPQKMNDADITALEEAHQQWLKTIPAASKLNDTIAEQGQVIVQELNSAILSMNDFNRKPSRFHLWHTQADVMKAILADRQIHLILQTTAR